MRVALDVAIGPAGARHLRGRGHEVVVEAREAEPDREWLERAIEAGAELVVSPDVDLEIMCWDRGIRFERVRQGRSGAQEAARVAEKIESAARRVGRGIAAGAGALQEHMSANMISPTSVHETPQLTTAYWITPRAVSRYRDHVRHEPSESNLQVAQRIDRNLRESVARGGQLRVVRDKEHPDTATTLVDVHHGSQKFVVVLRKHDPARQAGTAMVCGPGVPGLAAFSLLTDGQAEKMWADKKWQALPQVPLADQVARHATRMASRQLDAAEAAESHVGQPLPPEPEAAAHSITEQIASVVRPKRGGTMVERLAFARAKILANPDITFSGAGGLGQLIRTEFGASMSQRLLRDLRAQMARDGELPAVALPTDNPLALLARPPAPRAAQVAPRATALASELAEAIDQESAAIAVLDAAREAHDAAVRARSEASARVRAAMEAIAKIRGRSE